MRDRKNRETGNTDIRVLVLSFENRFCRRFKRRMGLVWRGWGHRLQILQFLSKIIFKLRDVCQQILNQLLTIGYSGGGQ